MSRHWKLVAGFGISSTKRPMTPYVCAFRGRRDSYQVPLALAEAGLLDHFITDAYAGANLRRLAKCLPETLKEKVEFRQIDGIPDGLVNSLWPETALEHLRHKLGFPHGSTYQLLDKRYSLAAAKRAETSQAHLFLYSSYAWEAFHHRYSHHPRKVLFQYHPHPDFESEILAHDRREFAGRITFDPRHDTGARDQARSRSDREAWRHADLVICASTFTKQSLLAYGAEESKCLVVPYGVDHGCDPGTSLSAQAPSETGFHAVFVGSGVQRKGLHHLLFAWRAARLPKGSTLTLICRNIEAPLKVLAETSPGVELIRGTSAVALQQKYASSHLFVMPSLVEGFGQVYLESLIQGCPVLGTLNTCLRDLGTELDGVFLTAPGEVAALVSELERLSCLLPGNAPLRQSTQINASRWTWSRFRRLLISHLKD